ncbi:putative isocitrate dehydrogenase [NAD] subunit beta, mitochondrial [Trichoplax sp. H2]|nr:putative isocitrate dehydrogenase [NAD] subunit beta, mitochondrial [Trichoplax sp. H2]|eukprot:RDD36696.1 putative isocitrate dehydrogenase [NAD] subunit beta, mitochondrial [Trichoplax sp. H2]
MIRIAISSLRDLTIKKSLPGVTTLATRSLHVGKPSCQKGEKRIITVIPGDGIGPELIDSVATLLNHVNAPIEFEEVPISDIAGSRLRGSDSLNKAVDSVQKNKIGLQGFVETAVHGIERPVGMRLINKLELFANVVNVKSIPGIKTRYGNIDFTIIREQTEDAFSGLEHETVPGVVENLKIITRKQSLKIAQFAFNYAQKNKLSKVTAVHKANIMCMVINPYQFKVLVVPNLYGSILSNLGAGLIGGAGFVPGYSIGREYVLYEQGARHSFGQGAGKDVANPTGFIISAVAMLRHMNLHTYADAIYNGLMKVIKNKKIKTIDMGGHASTTEFVQAMTEQIMPIV